jgi:riboflavin kinase/FMN adenylyltransferase
LIEATGVQHLIVVPFSKAFASLSPEEYVTDFLVKRFHPHTIIIGYDHRFGKDRKGDYMLLHQLGEQHNFVVKEIPEHVLRNITISSTRIRKALMEGDVTTANHFLGYPYPLSGTVVHGNKRGRTIGFPTANIQPEAAEKLTPAVGVYAVDVLVDGEQFRGMMNIGYRPTVDGSSLTVEVHILDFDRDIYDRSITVKMLSRLRDEKKFAGLDELKQQLGLDRKNAAAV